MEVISKHVREEKAFVTVEFFGEGGDVVWVQLKKDEDGMLTPLNAEEKAKAIMVQIATFDTDASDEAHISETSRSTEEPDIEHAQVSQQGTLDGTHGEPVSPAVISLLSARTAHDTGALEEQLDEGLKSTFPASDTVSATVSSIPGRRTDHPDAKSE
ncbi:hypothetical protein MUO32_27965 [Shinella sp. CPCC 101442]|uniref:hypothetical protein n=1 Tax=Shinella sp. CPCC 101442 TaxID=2932265 RepID=UPI0021521818|nr:hypothetical protein [Shinella sp. CPCC 101442]MCR6502866.1 hypothetical protein [Shinella sp. CPCC 101442]